MHHYRGAKSGFVGKNSALHAHLDRHLDALADKSAGDSLNAECALEYRRENRAQLRNVLYAYRHSTQEINDYHHRYDLFGY